MYLLDTNAIIILLYGEVSDGKLSPESIEKMKTADKLYLSVASLWEMAIKIKLGKLQIKRTIEEIESACTANGIEVIPIKAMHMDKSMELPLIQDHKDPFDRLILSVALTEELTLISTDARMRKPEYGVSIIC